MQGQIDELYRLPLDEFTKARNALARSLPGGEKKAVAALAKPPVSMWAINQLHWQDAPTYKALIDAAEKRRAAHLAALSGGKSDTRAADRLHRTTLERAFARSIAIVERRGVALSEAAREAIRRTLAALPTDEPAGRLTREPPPAGFGLITGVTPRAIKAPAEPAKPAREAKPRREDRERQRREEQERKRAVREKARTEKKARREREARERALREAEAALREAERRLAELKNKTDQIRD